MEESMRLVIQDMEARVAQMDEAREVLVKAILALRRLYGGAPEEWVKPSRKPSLLLGTTRLRILEELEKHEPQTAAMLQAKITDVTTVATHCSAMRANGQLAWTRNARGYWHSRGDSTKGRAAM